MSQWIESFAKWPPVNQLLFSCVFTASWLLLLFLAGLWAIQVMRYITICKKGWPVEETKPVDHDPTIIDKLLFELLHKQMPTVSSLDTADLLDLMTGKKKLVPVSVEEIGKPRKKEYKTPKEEPKQETKEENKSINRVESEINSIDKKSLI